VRLGDSRNARADARLSHSSRFRIWLKLSNDLAALSFSDSNRPETRIDIWDNEGFKL
jgi:hypothetical protein